MDSSPENQQDSVMQVPARAWPNAEEARIVYRTSRGADEGEVEHHGLGLHAMARHDHVGGLLKVGGVEVEEDEVQAAARELQSHGPAYA